MTQQNAVVSFFFSYCHCHNNNRTMSRVFLSLLFFFSFCPTDVAFFVRSNFCIVQSCPCASLPPFAAEALPPRITAVGARFLSSVSRSMQELNARQGLQDRRILFFFKLLFHVDAEQGASRRCYLISVHSHNPSHVKTLCHIFCCAFSFFFESEHTI